MESCAPGRAISLLETNAADFVLTSKPPADSCFEFSPLFADRFHFVVNGAHPLATKKHVSRDEIRRQRCLLLHSAGHDREQLDHFLSRSGIQLNVVDEVESVDTVKDLVTKSSFMSILPGWRIAAELKKRAFVALPQRRKPFDQTWGFVYLPGRSLNLIESTFLKFCRRRIIELNP